MTSVFCPFGDLNANHSQTIQQSRDEYRRVDGWQWFIRLQITLGLQLFIIQLSATGAAL